MNKNGKGTHKNLKSRSQVSLNNGTLASHVPDTGKDALENAIPVDPSLFDIPTSSAKQNIIETADCKAILSLIKLQENVIRTRPKVATTEIQKFFGFHMNLLELSPKNSETNKTSYQLSGANELNTELYTLDLHSDELQLLKVSSLELLSLLVHTAKKSRVFSFWYAFLPGATSNPFKLGVFDLLDHKNEVVRAKLYQFSNLCFYLHLPAS